MEKKLYLVSTPIGNFDDITIRAIKILNSVDFIICEEFKEAKRLLSHLKINNELISLNEHNEEKSSIEVLTKLNEGKTAALISDCGTPLFSDPGYILVKMCLDSGIEIISIPGANSLLPALIGSGFKIDKFFYAGWLSPKSEIRRKELLRLKNLKELIVIMETPYRLKTILTDISKIFGSSTKISIAFDISLPTEKYLRGIASEILHLVINSKLKGEFVIVIDNNR